MFRFFFIIAFSSLTSCSSIDVNLIKEDFEGWNLECPSGSYLFDTNYFKSTLIYRERATKRCEIANRTLLRLGEPFSFSFTFLASRVDYTDENWHSIFQLHSFPDLQLEESWRCPVSALEIKNGHMRMFNRWDNNELSKTTNGTCASSENSIFSRLLFDGYRLEENTTYHVVVSGIMSYESIGILKVDLNGENIVYVTGPNTFNDAKGPYIKLGIYKPTSWNALEDLSYSYLNISFKDEVIED